MEPSSVLRILSFGAGAIGTYIGGSLALAGHRVVFIERPDVVGTVRQNGLRLSLDGEEKLVSAPLVTGTLAEALDYGPFDAAIFALKSFDTQAALEGMPPYQSQLPPIVCLQNGVENEVAISQVLGPEKVVAGTITSAIGRRGIGDIVRERLRGMGLATSDGQPALAERLAKVLDQAGLNCRLYPRAADMKWSKMLTNLVGNATSSILDMTPAEVFGHPGLYRLEIAQLRETLAVMSAQGIDVVDLPATPVRLLSLGARLPAGLSRPLMARAVGGGRGGKMPSFHIDLHGGRGQSEVDWLNGAVVRAGERLGITTPVNRLLNQTLLKLTRGETPMNTYAHRPKVLLDEFANARH